MNSKTQMIIKVDGIGNMHEANPNDTHFLIPNASNNILFRYSQMASAQPEQFVSTFVLMYARYRLPWLYDGSFIWALTLLSISSQSCIPEHYSWSPDQLSCVLAIASIPLGWKYLLLHQDIYTPYQYQSSTKLVCLHLHAMPGKNRSSLLKDIGTKENNGRRYNVPCRRELIYRCFAKLKNLSDLTAS